MTTGAGATIVNLGQHSTICPKSRSILLSHPHGLGGGQLMTSQDGTPVVHAMSRGDALLFPSLKTHNVSPITHGQRRSLVIELWAGETNLNNRYT